MNARNKWLRRKAMGILQAMLQNMYGTAINKAVCKTGYEGRDVWGGDNQGGMLDRT
jgi:hypothetical protein